MAVPSRSRRALPHLRGNLEGAAFRDWPFRRIDYLFVLSGAHGGPGKGHRGLGVADLAIAERLVAANVHSSVWLGSKKRNFWNAPFEDRFDTPLTRRFSALSTTCSLGQLPSQRGTHHR